MAVSAQPMMRFGHSLVTEHATRARLQSSSHTMATSPLRSRHRPIGRCVMSTGTVPGERLHSDGWTRSGLLLFARWSCEMMCQGAVVSRRWTNHIKSRSRHGCLAMSRSPVHTHRRHQYHSASSLRHVPNTLNLSPRTAHAHRKRLTLPHTKKRLLPIERGETGYTQGRNVRASQIRIRAVRYIHTRLRGSSCPALNCYAHLNFV